MINRVLFGALKHMVRIVGYGAIGAILALVIVAVVHLDSRPDLSAD